MTAGLVGPQQVQDRPRTTVWTVLLIVLIIVCLFMCSFVAFFQNPIINKSKDLTTAKIAGETFYNPNGNAVTKNSGGWALRFTSVGGPRLDLKDLVLALKTPSSGTTPSHVWFFHVKGTGNHSADLSYEGRTFRWDLKAFNSTTVPLRYINNTVAVGLNTTTAKNLRADQFSTVEGAVAFYDDVDLDGNLSINDKITIYKDVNADGIVELTSGTLLELQTLDGKLVSSAILK